MSVDIAESILIGVMILLIVGVIALLAVGTYVTRGAMLLIFPAIAAVAVIAWAIGTVAAPFISTFMR